VDLNARGDVAGWALTAGGKHHATLVTSPTLYERVMDVANGLPATPRQFSDASARLTDALNPNMWNSAGTALTYPDGAHFFDLLKQAVDRLDKVSNNAQAQQAVAELWAIARELAAHAVDHAASTPGALASDLELAQRQLAAAQDRWSADHSDAFERLKQAWTSAEAALQ